MYYLYEILVPTIRRDNGKPYRTKYHKVWDQNVIDICKDNPNPGLTITHPSKGQWIHKGQNFNERMIPVRIFCTKQQIEAIAEFSGKYYDQLAIMYYLISSEVTIKLF